MRVATLCFAAFARVENLVERTFVYVPQNHIQILANRHVAVGMNHQLVEDTVATQPQALIFPLVVERHEIEVFVRFVDRRRNLPQEIGVCRVDQSRSGVEKRHRAVDTDAHIDAIALGHGNDVLHVAERVPGREAKHERNGNPFVPLFDDLHHLLVTVDAPHVSISAFVPVEREVEVFRVVLFQHLREFLRSQSVRQQGIVRMVRIKPPQDGIRFRMQQKFSAF